MPAFGETSSRRLAGVTRRDELQVGGLGAAGLTLPDLLRARAAARPARPGGQGSFGRARSCILCFLFGAPAHQDVWDLKPDAPAEYRGEFRPVASSVPGIRVGEHVPRVARTAHRLALVRSVQHPDNTHTVAMHYMLTGRRHAQPDTNPRNQPTDFPCFGAVMQHLRPDRAGLPSGVSLNAPANQVSANNHVFPGFFAGLLGRRYDPMFVAQDPSAPGFDPLPTAGAAEAGRLGDCRGLLDAVDRGRRAMDACAAVRDFGADHRQAFDLVTSAAARRAFDLGREPDAVLARYGLSPFGQGCLLARRLVEA